MRQTRLVAVVVVVVMMVLGSIINSALFIMNSPLFIMNSPLYNKRGHFITVYYYYLYCGGQGALGGTAHGNKVPYASDASSSSSSSSSHDGVR
jgi:hypothetical protein